MIRQGPGAPAGRLETSGESDLRLADAQAITEFRANQQMRDKNVSVVQCTVLSHVNLRRGQSIVGSVAEDPKVICTVPPPTDPCSLNTAHWRVDDFFASIPLKIAVYNEVWTPIWLACDIQFIVNSG